jgi:chemotaxis protein CheX
MSQTVQITEVSEFMKRHLADVFDTMLAMKPVLLPEAKLPSSGGRVTGAVGFGGERVTGAVYLHLTEPLARQVTAAMLGLTLAEITGEDEVNDVVGEVTNMLTGGLKSWLCDAGIECAVSTPAIIRGTAYDIESMPDVKREWLVFECGQERFVVEVHVKLN